MSASYHIDTSKYSLQEMKKDLLDRDLIHSRQPLKDDLEINFQILESAGIYTLRDLISALKKKSKIGELSSRLGISENYLILLRREANSYLPNPVSLDRFSGFNARDIEKLAAAGIRNSRQLFDLTKNNQVNLSADLELARETLTELVGLSDLVRAYGVGPAFARILYDTGIHSIGELRNLTPRQVIDLYEKETGKKADFSVDDIKFSLDLVKALDIR